MAELCRGGNISLNINSDKCTVDWNITLNRSRYDVDRSYLQYWRLVIADNYGDPNACLAEVQFFGVGEYELHCITNVTPCHTMSHHVTPCYSMSHHVTPCYTMSIWNTALYCISWGSSHSVMLTLNDTLYISLSCYITLCYIVWDYHTASHYVTLCDTIIPHHKENATLTAFYVVVHAENGVIEWFERLDLKQYLKTFVQRVSTRQSYFTPWYSDDDTLTPWWSDLVLIISDTLDVLTVFCDMYVDTLML